MLSHIHYTLPNMTSERGTGKYRSEITQMMYVAGETADSPLETTQIIEEVVREQVVEILQQCQEQAIRRGVRTITVNDLFFLIRKDVAKTDRLKNFLSWKDVRKSAKDSDDKGDGADIGADELGGGEAVPAGPMVGDAGRKGTKRAKIVLPWDPESFYSTQVPEREDEEDDDQGESNEATLKRLRAADERTRNMTREEYVHWSECRQASFTFRKSKRFREWAGFGVITDGKPNDDIIDILGFLTFEMVQTLTEEALQVKKEDELYRLKTGGEGDDGPGNGKKRKVDRGPFEQEEGGKEPIHEGHVREAYRRLQQRARKPKPWMGARNAAQKIRIQLI